VALTLRYAAGLTTREIAAAFLLPEPTIAQRLVRAKAQDPRGRHPVRGCPPPGRWRNGWPASWPVVYLVFNEGYAATRSEEALVRADPVRGGHLAGAAAAPAAARRRGDHRCCSPLMLLSPLPGGRPPGRRRPGR